MLNGSIEVNSVKGQGSTFTITIPFQIADKADVASFETYDYTKKQFKGKRILLAEDNDLNAEIACEILKEAGIETERVPNGKECVEKIENTPAKYYNLILMDIQMPIMNGYDATRAIRKLPDTAKANIPVIAMTANAFEEDKRNAFDAGMNGHIAKPLNLNDLFKQLAATL